MQDKRFKKVDWTKRDYALIRDLIRVIRHYNDKLNMDKTTFCASQFQRFLIGQYLLELRNDLSLEWETIRFLKQHNKELRP